LKGSLKLIESCCSAIPAQAPFSSDLLAGFNTSSDIVDALIDLMRER
jgi:hypothetical protein